MGESSDRSRGNLLRRKDGRVNGVEVIEVVVVKARRNDTGDADEDVLDDAVKVLLVVLDVPHDVNICREPVKEPIEEA